MKEYIAYEKRIQRNGIVLLPKWILSRTRFPSAGRINSNVWETIVALISKALDTPSVSIFASVRKAPREDPSNRTLIMNGRFRREGIRNEQNKHIKIQKNKQTSYLDLGRGFGASFWFQSTSREWKIQREGNERMFLGIGRNKGIDEQKTNDIMRKSDKE